MNEVFNVLGFNRYIVDEKFNLIHKSSALNVNSSFVEKLSDGEKSLISFVLFYSELILGYYKEAKLIVIDDPVCSLDYDNIYNIFYMVDAIIKSFDNTKFLILTHNHIYFNCLTYQSNKSVYRIISAENEKSKI